MTLAVNSFLNSTTRTRSIHRGLAAACERYLVDIQGDADLRAFSLDQVVELLNAACQVPYILVPVRFLLAEQSPEASQRGVEEDQTAPRLTVAWMRLFPHEVGRRLAEVAWRVCLNHGT